MGHYDYLFEIVDEMQKQGIKAYVEGGGAMVPFIQATLKDGKIVLFGDLNETWDGQIYNDEEALATCDYSGGENTDLPCSNHNPKDVTAAFLKAFSQ